VAEERVVAEVQWARDLGYPEVVLTGVNLGAYGLEHGRSLIDLLRRLGAIAGVPRIRLSSLEPNYLSDELLELFSEINICPHLHLPIQSADRSVLHRMGRDYAAGAIARWIETAVRRYPAFAFGADLITGFPGEDEAAFNRTYEFIDRLPIAYLHVFPYSPRPGTEAARMPDNVSPLAKQHRVQRLRALSRAKSYAFRQRFVGQRVTATAEKSRRGVCGLSDNYVRFYIDRLPTTRLFEARLTEVTELSTRGEAL
jgi:threonylcarbamoyladenosine tRNA methylthiotransferase MtaB